MRTAIVGGGAAGFFLAINLKEMCPEMQVTIFERSERVLQKVKISGGGRCNCTNTFEGITDISQAYPRGHRLMKRLLKGFDQHDAYAWFERHGVSLVTQADECVFPASQDSQSIINCFLQHSQRLGVQVQLETRITSLESLHGYDFIALAIGGQPHATQLQWLEAMGHTIEKPVPSLFTFNIQNRELRSLMGTVVEDATTFIPGTKLKAQGPLLITHWGMSGPAILKLSSYAARYLAESHYQSPLAVNWVCQNEEQVRKQLTELLNKHPQKQLSSLHPFGLPTRLWNYLLDKAGTTNGQQIICASVSKKLMNRLVCILTADSYTISSRCTYKEEFVTCGGIALSSVHPNTLESRHRQGLFFAGELLDIDGITGGFNFQAAWTTAFTIAKAIADKVKEKP